MLDETGDMVERSEGHDYSSRIYVPKKETVCVIVPCRNEERYIESCINSILDFELPHACRIELFVLDGGSTDSTKLIVSTLAGRHANIQLLENPGRYQGFAVNMVVKVSPADYFLWLGAHTQFPKNYVRLCLETLGRSGADIVGGRCITLPGGTEYGAELVQALTTHWFGVGNSGFRTGAAEGPVDTVAYALFRRSVFERVGYLDERLVRAQDYEFNQRARVAGMVVWFNPEIYCSYYNQPTLSAFFRKQILLEAPYNAYMWYLGRHSFTIRHGVSPCFSLGVLGGLLLSGISNVIAVTFASIMCLYFTLAVYAASKQAIRYQRRNHLLTLPFLFFGYHFGHGLGVIWGLLRLACGIAPVQKRSAACAPASSSPST